VLALLRSERILQISLLITVAAIPLLAGLSQRTWRDFGMTRERATAAASGSRPVSAATDVVGGAS
jgi:hypothetical protein